MILWHWPSDDHAHDNDDDWSENINVFDVGEMIPYVDTILREDDKVNNIDNEIILFGKSCQLAFVCY